MSKQALIQAMLDLPLRRSGDTVLVVSPGTQQGKSMLQDVRARLELTIPPGLLPEPEPLFKLSTRDRLQIKLNPPSPAGDYGREPAGHFS